MKQRSLMDGLVLVLKREENEKSYCRKGNMRMAIVLNISKL